MVSGGVDERGAQGLKKEKVREETDELKKGECDEGAENADDERHRRDRDDSRVGREVAEL